MCETTKTIKIPPAVFAVNHDYQIMLYTDDQCLMWVKVGDNTYYDEDNGILRSCTKVHRVTVPMRELDTAKSYTVCLRYIINRKPYFPELEPVKEFTFEFRPVESEKPVRAYHIADAHNWAEGPIAAADTYGNIDFLILNGDIPDHSGTIEKCVTIYELAAAVTGGNIPVVFARGNHDLRGLMAEKLSEHTPSDGGKTYFTFRLGGIWGMALDCGEDKDDTSSEYGGTICCHAFRQRETEFIQNIVSKATEEYLAEGVTHRIVVCHNPFTMHHPAPFHIESEIFDKWTKILSDEIKPNALICGHLHTLHIIRPGDEKDNRGQKFPVAVASAKKDREYFAGGGFTFDRDGILVTFTDNQGNVIREERL